ncbi:uncharacterized protein LOC110826592 [Zootermopsis nevadensis]|uniref:uncharacterized protein LOC110826592 n=1 Tax=Zootermopsis nevadensis TaxID=136037 RepID=UPI000B8E2DDB|nr:uncharacterized protein LOC110826592 [Zootermopsis nevadensis]
MPQLTCSAMGPLTLLATYIILTLSVARCQQWNKTATPLVIFHVGAHVRSTCVFLYYNQESLMLDKIRLLVQVQKALTLRQMASAVISIDQLIAHHHLGCRSNRPLYVLFSSATLLQTRSGFCSATFKKKT